jgi:membrane protein YqaA with SNARE-associated domain
MTEEDPTLRTISDEAKGIEAGGGEDKAKAAKQPFLSRQLYLRTLVLILVLAITVSIFAYRDRVADLSGYGYLGAFLISLLSSATIILPIPGIAVIFALGATYDPYLVGLAAGAGSALGELSGYMAGYTGQGVFQKSKTYLRMEHWMRRRGSLVIFVLAFVPNPIFDLAGAAAGILKYPAWKFLFFCFLGKTPRSILVAFAGAWALEGVLKFIERYF